MAQQAYWSAFQQVLNEVSGPVLGNRKPWPRSWIAYPIGRSAFNLAAVMTRSNNLVRAELYIKGVDAKAFFYLLREQRHTIGRELGCQLGWEELPARQDSRIAVYLSNADPEDEKDWPRQHDWLAAKLNDLHRVFVNRVRQLDVAEWQPDQEDDTGQFVSKTV